MADVNSLSELIRKQAFYNSGGMDVDPVEKTNQLIGTITGAAKAGLDIKKSHDDIIMNVLKRKSEKIAQDRAKQELTPYRDIVSPLTPANAEVDENTTPERMAAIDKLYADREAMGDASLGQVGMIEKINAQKAKANQTQEVLPVSALPSEAKARALAAGFTEDGMIDIRKFNALKTTDPIPNQTKIDEDRDATRTALKEQRDQTNADRRLTIQTNLINRFNQTQNVKKYQGAVDASDNVIELINSGNPIADSAIPTYIARASGEVGNLSEADKAPFGGTQALIGKLGQVVERAKTGKLTSENREFVRQLAETMKSSAIKNKINYAKTFAKQYSRLGDYGREPEILATIAPESLENNVQVPAIPGEIQADQIQRQLPAGAKIKSIKRIQ